MIYAQKLGVQTNFGSRKILGLKNFGPKKFVSGFENISCSKLLWVQESLWSKNLWMQKSFESVENLGSKKFHVLKHFGYPTIFGSKKSGSRCSSVVLLLRLGGRARKSMVSWYPGYQPMSILAANFGWAEGTDSHHLRINSQ